MKVVLENIATGKLQQINVGFDSTLFYLAGFFGLPFFCRRLYVLGLLFAMLSALDLILLESLPATDLTFSPDIWVYSLARLALQVWLGINGHKITARHLLAHGWKFANPEDETTRWARRKWGIETRGRS
jgi:hypothetical protein